MVPIVGWAITYAALCAVPAVAFTYVVDCYKPLAGETTTILVAFKNSFAFGISFAVVPWILKDGFVKVRYRFTFSHMSTCFDLRIRLLDSTCSLEGWPS